MFINEFLKGFLVKMDIYPKIAILYLASITILTPILYFTFIWINSGDIVSGLSGTLFFMTGIWIFLKTMAKIKSPEKEREY